jgi:hypothetical protein
MMATWRWLAVTTLTLLSFQAPSAGAHHSYAMFDQQKNITLEGTVKELQWTNPHIWIQLAVPDSSGKEVEWSIEGQSPNMLIRAGWTRHAVAPGDEVVIVIHPVRDANTHSGSLASASVNGRQIYSGHPQGEGPGEGEK